MDLLLHRDDDDDAGVRVAGELREGSYVTSEDCPRCGARLDARPLRCTPVRDGQHVYQAAACRECGRRSAGKLVDGLKNSTSRVVYLPEIVQGALAVHRRQMILDQHPGLASGLIFPSIKGGVRGKGTMRKVFKAACKALDFEFKITPQVWRRAFNTWMLEGKTDVTVLHAMIGHSDLRQTRRYAGVHLEAKSKSVHQSLDTLIETMDALALARNEEGPHTVRTFEGVGIGGIEPPTPTVSG
jgi:hypothetical protein